MVLPLKKPIIKCKIIHRILVTNSRMGTRKLTLIAILGALYAAGSMIGLGFPLLGMPGSRIDVVRSLEMGYGIILGPTLGPITAFIGALVGKIISGGGFGLWFTPLAPLTAFVAASLSSNRIYGVKGWIVSTVALAVLIIGWYLSPIGRKALYYPVLHLIALTIILFFRGKISEYINSEERSKISVGIALTSYTSTMTGHMLGNLIFMALVPTDHLFFISILPVTALERIVMTILSIAIMTPLTILIRDAFPELSSTLQA